MLARTIGRLLGLFLAAFGGTLSVPVGLSLAEGGSDLVPIAGAMALTVIAGSVLWTLCRAGTRELSQRQGILLTVGAWIGVGLFASLPLLLRARHRYAHRRCLRVGLRYHDHWSFDPSRGRGSVPSLVALACVLVLARRHGHLLHYRALVQRRPMNALGDYEFRYYVGAIAIAAAVTAVTLSLQLGYGAEKALRTALFQVTSIMTTTGFATDDFELWPPLGQLVLLVLMFLGGCTGSTASGMKISRIAVLAKVVGREFKRMVERHGVFAVRLGGRVIPEPTIQSLLNLVYLAFVVNFASCLALSALGIDILTAISAVAAAMFNIGPALGGVGPTENYSHLPTLAKWVLSFNMIAGRLEFYPLLVTATPWFWRK